MAFFFVMVVFFVFFWSLVFWAQQAAFGLWSLGRACGAFGLWLR